MTGTSGMDFKVNDPGFEKTVYTHAEVVRAAIYKRPSGCASLLSTSEFIDLESLDLTEFATQTGDFEIIEEASFLE